eukprot:SAG11_NODE_2327_length_3516_cov_2.408838_5_plen_192_part_00
MCVLRVSQCGMSFRARTSLVGYCSDTATPMQSLYADLPSLGFCMLVPALLLVPPRIHSAEPAATERGEQAVAAAACMWRTRRAAGLVLLGAMALSNAARTWVRNADWQDCATLWESSAAALPTNEYLPWARAACAEELGEDVALREQYLRKALEINPKCTNQLSSPHTRRATETAAHWITWDSWLQPHSSQ